MSPAAVEWHSDSPTQHVVKAPHKRLPVGADEASPGDAAEFPRPSLQLSAQQPPRCQRNPWMQRAGHRLAYVLFSQDRGRKRSVSQLVVPTARIEVSSSYSCLSQTCKILQVTERSRTGDLKSATHNLSGAASHQDTRIAKRSARRHRRGKRLGRLLLRLGSIARDLDFPNAFRQPRTRARLGDVILTCKSLLWRFCYVQAVLLHCMYGMRIHRKPPNNVGSRAALHMSKAGGRGV